MSTDGEPPVIPAMAEPEKEDFQRLWKPGFLLAILIIALIAIAFTASFMSLYGYLEKVIWFENDFVQANRWTIPAGVLFFSFLVGLCQRYLHAPNEIHGSFVASMKEGRAGSELQDLSRFFPLVPLFPPLRGEHRARGHHRHHGLADSDLAQDKGADRPGFP